MVVTRNAKDIQNTKNFTQSTGVCEDERGGKLVVVIYLHLTLILMWIM